MEKCAEIRRRTVGEEDSETANAYNNLGNVYLNTSDFENSLRFYKMSYEIKIKKNGKNSPDTACAMNNIGFAYFNKDEFRRELNSEIETENINNND